MVRAISRVLAGLRDGYTDLTALIKRVLWWGLCGFRYGILAGLLRFAFAAVVVGLGLSLLLSLVIVLAQSLYNIVSLCI